MNLVELTHHTTDEEGAEAYLREHGILKTFGECPQSPKQQGLGVHNGSTFGCGYIGCSLKGMKELIGTPPTLPASRRFQGATATPFAPGPDGTASSSPHRRGSEQDGCPP